MKFLHNCAINQKNCSHNVTHVTFFLTAAPKVKRNKIKSCDFYVVRHRVSERGREGERDEYNDMSEVAHRNLKVFWQFGTFGFGISAQLQLSSFIKNGSYCWLRK